MDSIASNTSIFRYAAVAALVSCVIRYPLFCRTLGEADQGAILIDALTPVSNPNSTRLYGWVTSPAWTWICSLLSSWYSAREIIWWTNLGGWVCGGLLAATSTCLLLQFRVRATLAASSALAITFTPGVFYCSLYGYPSQFSLTALVLSAMLYVESGHGNARRRIVFAVLSLTAFVIAVLFKVDFALAGLFLFALRILSGAVRSWSTVMLLAFPVIANGTLRIVTSVQPGTQRCAKFYRWWHTRYDVTGSITDIFFDEGFLTVFAACGYGTIILGFVALVRLLWTRESRHLALRVFLAIVVCVPPLWIFWELRHLGYNSPMSTRHALPGAYSIAFFTVLLVSWCLQGNSAATDPTKQPTNGRLSCHILALPLVILVSNWFFVLPSSDFNYSPSGNLLEMARRNRAAFRVVDGIADEIAASVRGRSCETVLILGEYTNYSKRLQVLDGIDPYPAIAIALSEGHTMSSLEASRFGLRIDRTDGSSFELHPYVRPAELAHREQHAISFAPRGLTDGEMEIVRSFLEDVKVFDPNARHTEALADTPSWDPSRIGLAP